MTDRTPAPQIVTVPCLKDNYAYLVHDAETGRTAVIDVPEADPIKEALAARGWQLSDILITHHHWDHVDGVNALREATGAAVWGAAADAERLPPLDHAVTEGDEVRIGNLAGHVIDVSGHTINHIAFHFPALDAVFTADSLMALGCGRLFEGTPDQMWRSLQKLAALPHKTWVCSGHEYTASNASFALTIEPGNAALISRSEGVRAARAAGKPTVPSLLSEELDTNPFLRPGNPELRRRLDMEDASDAEVFAEIRERKDRF